MTVFGSPLHTDSDAKATSSRFGDPGDGVTDWHHLARIVDGADVAQGDRSDVAALSGDGTVIALLKALRAGIPGTPINATRIRASSGNVANAPAVASLAGSATKTTHITGFQVNASGATAALPVTVTVAGLTGGSNSYTFVFPAGVLIGATPLAVQFVTAIPASAPNTAIVVTCPASGAGGTNCTVNAQGYTI